MSNKYDTMALLGPVVSTVKHWSPKPRFRVRVSAGPQFVTQWKTASLSMMSAHHASRLEQRSHVFLAGKTNELVPDIFSFMKIEVLLWCRQIRQVADLVAGESRRSRRSESLFYSIFMEIRLEKTILKCLVSHIYRVPNARQLTLPTRG